MTANEFIEKYSTAQQRTNLGGGWGLSMDQLHPKQLPPEYSGADFYQMNHDEIVRFFRMPEDEQFLYAYWAQRRNAHRAAKTGFFVGVGVTIAVAIVFVQILSSF